MSLSELNLQFILMTYLILELSMLLEQPTKAVPFNYTEQEQPQIVEKSRTTDKLLEMKFDKLPLVGFTFSLKRFPQASLELNA